jgi:hypothetical protein
MNFFKKRAGKILTFILSTSLGFFMLISSAPFNGIEKRLIFEPRERNTRCKWIDEKDFIKEIYFYSRDGVKLNAWYIKAENNNPTIIYCHGQGENISLWQNIIEFLSKNGYGIFMLEYRGHGKSEGDPTESGLYVDLESAIKYLQENENIFKDNIILWGRSLGGAIVADVASRDDFKGVILDSTFTNIRSEAIHLTSTGILESKIGFWKKISYFSVRFLPITQKFETDKKIYKIKSPLLIGHSINDTTVPVEMSYKLANLNRKAKLFISNKGSHHDSEWFFHEVLKFIESLT